MRLRAYIATATVCVLLAPVSIRAHHSFAAEFDKTKPVTLHGTVTKMQWLNPHAWLYLDVKGSDGTIVNWAIECGAPNALVRRGWRMDSLPPGTEIVVEGYLSKSGKAVANGSNLTFPDGKTLFVGSSGTGAPSDTPRK
jgi:hypothetical protein